MAGLPQPGQGSHAALRALSELAPDGLTGAPENRFPSTSPEETLCGEASMQSASELPRTRGSREGDGEATYLPWG